MQYIKDPTGRFAVRPFYEDGELDYICEQVITEFVAHVHGRILYPVPTETLTKIIERDAQDLDLYADATDLGPNVEGVTRFIPGERTRVAILRSLSEKISGRNRLRTTLTHEYGHVYLHDCLWQQKGDELDLFGGSNAQETHRCNRDNIIQSSRADWMEWQAGYASGAFLMPASELGRLVERLISESKKLGTIAANSTQGRLLEEAVCEHFAVSAEAARVRLEQHQYIAPVQPAGSLFREG